MSCHRFPFAALPLLLAFGLGCSEATQRVDFGPGFLQLELPEAWQPAATEASELAFALTDDPRVELHLSRRQDDLGSAPLTASAIKALLGRELNYEYGNARTFVTLEGNALVAYAPPPADGFAQFNWVLARPLSVGYLIRTDVSLRVPAAEAQSEATGELVDDIERHLGDAIFLAGRPGS